MRLRLTLLLTFVVLCAGAAVAQLPVPGAGPNLSPDIRFSGAVHAREGNRVQGSFTIELPHPWHINSWKPVDEFAIPTVVTFDAVTAEPVEIRYPQHQLKSFAFTAGSQIAVYEGTVQIPFTANVKGETVRATLRYQACDDKVCLPPKDITTEFPSTPQAGSGPPAASAGGFTPLTAAPADAAGGRDVRPPQSSDRLASTFAARGLPLTLGVLFLAGLALNLTPCVYPLIPITIGYFSSQSGERRARRVALSGLYVLGLATTYSVLGVAAALSGKLFGAWLQHPGVLVFFALLMVTMAASMFGLFEIRVPQFISNRSGGQAGYAGALTMGLLIGIVAAPCVGPFVISLIALVSSLQSVALGFVMFFVLALGLGLPYLLLGIFSSALTALPRSGDWMVQVKKAMGFVLIAMAIYFLRPLTGESVFRWGVAGSLLIGAAFLFASRSKTGRVMRFACGALLLVAGAAFAIPRGGGVQLSWTKYDAKAIEAAVVSKKPVIIDFYADWCLPCKELDQKTFSDARVADELERFVRIKADLTRPEDEATKELTKTYAIVGVPTIVFISSEGHEVPSLRLTGFEGPEAFYERAKQVR